MNLLTVGTVALDSIETPYGKAEMIVGGSCTYVSLAASYFTKNINVSAVIGEDFPKKELAYLRNRGIDLDGLEIKAGEKSFFWAGRYHRNMNQRDTLVTDLNVLADFNPLLPQHYRQPDLVMLGNLTPEIQGSVLAQLTQKPKLVALDTMNFWMNVALEKLKEVLTQVDVLTINDEEARQLSGEYALINAAKVILSMGPRYLIIKKGEHGAMLFYKDKMFYVPALPLAHVYDPTGAGDTFAGGFMGYIAKTGDTTFENIKRALVYGSAMASFCVEKFGIEGLKGLTQDKINQRIHSFKEMMHVTLTL